MHDISRQESTALTLLMCTLLSACGGGGGGGGTGLQVQVSGLQVVNEGDSLLLEASASSTNSDANLSFHWQQIQGPSVQLLATGVAGQVRFVAPQVTGDPLPLAFRVDVSDGIRSDVVDWHVSVIDLPPGKLQQVVAARLEQPITAGESITLDYTYRTLPGSEALPGLGLRLHWQSSRVTIDTIEPLVSLGFQGVGAAQPDDNNLDGDPATDRYQTLAWADLSGLWPLASPVPGPQPLFRVTLTALPDTAPGTIASSLRLSPTSTSAGYLLSGPRVQFSVTTP